MKNFQDKVVVITGAGSGIGRSLAIRFSELGANLALGDINLERLEETKVLLNIKTKVLLYDFDVSKRQDFELFANKVIETFGGVDVVINNAGVAISQMGTLDLNYEDFEWIFGINLWGVIYGSKIFLPHLRKKQASVIVNLSSVFGLHGMPLQAPYCTTKAAVMGFTQSLFLEEQIAKTGVHAISVHPGGIKTRIAKDARGSEKDKEIIKQFEKMLVTSADKAAVIIINGIKTKKHKVLIGCDAKLINLGVNLAPSLFKKAIVFVTKKVLKQNA